MAGQMEPFCIQDQVQVWSDDYRGLLKFTDFPVVRYLMGNWQLAFSQTPNTNRKNLGKLAKRCFAAGRKITF